MVSLTHYETQTPKLKTPLTSHATPYDTYSQKPFWIGRHSGAASNMPAGLDKMRAAASAAKASASMARSKLADAEHKLEEKAKDKAKA